MELSLSESAPRTQVESKLHAMMYTIVHYDDIVFFPSTAYVILYIILSILLSYMCTNYKLNNVLGK